MDKQNYKLIYDAVEAILSNKGFQSVKDDSIEYFSNGERAVMIDYTESTALINLKISALSEGQSVEWKTISSWLFDANTSENDKKSIANDFCDSINEFLGIKASIQKIDMPAKKSKSEVIDVESFTARFLAIYPAYKDAYKENISKYGDFMYDKFFSEFAVNEFTQALRSDNKKQIMKLIDLFSISYVNGDSAVNTLVIYTIIGGSLLDDKNLAESAYTYMEKYPHLKRASSHIVGLLSNPKNQKTLL